MTETTQVVFSSPLHSTDSVTPSSGLSLLHFQVSLKSFCQMRNEMWSEKTKWEREWKEREREKTHHLKNARVSSFTSTAHDWITSMCFTNEKHDKSEFKVMKRKEMMILLVLQSISLPLQWTKEKKKERGRSCGQQFSGWHFPWGASENFGIVMCLEWLLHFLILWHFLI